MQRARPFLRAAIGRAVRLLACGITPASEPLTVARKSCLFPPPLPPPCKQSRVSSPTRTWKPLVPTRTALPPLRCLTVHRQHFLGLGDGDEDPGLSKQHEERRLIGYSPEQLYAVVAAVDLYEDFVPWCQKSTILWRKGEENFDAELEIGFQFLVERYISHVELKRPTLVKTSVSQSKLFEYLNTIWEFKPGPTPWSCNLHFFVDFQFRSPLYRQVANMFFNEVVSCLVSSFEDRCNTVYGPSTKVLENRQVA